ncbi:unnamed protein product [Prorocentrum cordatum]|uniref:Sperm-tail PG-rich repeat-containing protein 2 n=1 Tax=Prorocentrum cordatum TaxID=2364126 RepID=A0ABN9SW41_9DINO|nr:unnamed protein product [Polarella glacialis]
MAWTSKSTRFTAAQEDANPVVGPGSYAAPPPPRRQTEPSYAPFGSDKARITSEPRNEDRAERYPVPPPGAYDPKLPSSYNSGLPRKAAPFLSSALRAGGVPADAKEFTPGPGAYEAPEASLRVEACRTMGAPQGVKGLMFRSASAPSIPRAQQCFGYEESGDGRLVRQPPKNASQLLAGVGAETAGPGHYEVGTRGEKQKAPLGVFGRGPPRTTHKVVETPGPGHYMERGAPRGRGPLSSLASGTERLASKAEERPGPGAYSVTAPGRKSLRELNPELQFFGSTAERFQRKPSDGVPGPGQYEAPRKRAARPPAKTSFGISDRFEGPCSHAALTSHPELPGPGAYEQEVLSKTSGALGTASVLASTGVLAFGSMQSRATRGVAETPGPGNYEAPAGLSAPEHAAPQGQLRTGRAHPPNAVFASESAKNSLMHATLKEAERVPPPGQYTPLLARDTSAVVRMPPKSEGFLSAAPRSAPPARAELGPGPGMYTPGELTGGKRLGTYNRAIAEGLRGGFGFGHSGKRFSDKAAATPGPGAHQVQSSWVSKSYNVHFGGD